MYGHGGAGGAPHPFMMFQQGQTGMGMGPETLDPFRMFFGQGGMAGGGAFAEQLFAAASGGVPPATQPERAGPPPTSASAFRSLPRIKVTPYDIAANESAECAICLDELVPGQPALRIPCGHLYHDDCVKDWLKKSNECPVCRFELPTDDIEYERGRKQRMAGRKLRMRRADLTVKTVQELSRLASYIGVDVRGCLEKSEVVERIAASPLVQIIPTEGSEAASTVSAADATAGRPAVFTQPQLEAMSLSELRALMERLGVDHAACPERADLVQHLVNSGRVLVEAAPCPAPEAASCPAPQVSLAGRSVGQLRQLARELGVSLEGCLEKAELVQRIEASPAFRGSA